MAPQDPTASWTTDGADYARTKEYRRKYGFGIYAGIAYPDAEWRRRRRPSRVVARR
ncbi:hypothetical protein [Streptomyces sp. NPDC007904]|uniref:hypothetical protein n=1 Tax=Streptomyces sp. NPDC007904 TaxID=3364787 RepID=UPI0036E4EEB1